MMSSGTTGRLRTEEKLIANRLLKGECIIWSGPPGRGIIFTARDALNIPVSLLALGFFIFFAIASARSQPPSFAWFGALLICVALYWVAGRFVLDAWMRRGMRYAVTNH